MLNKFIFILRYSPPKNVTPPVKNILACFDKFFCRAKANAECGFLWFEAL